MKKILAVILAVVMLAVNVHSADARLVYNIPSHIIKCAEGAYQFDTPAPGEKYHDFDYKIDHQNKTVIFNTGVGYVEAVAAVYDKIQGFSDRAEFLNAAYADFDAFVMTYECDVENPKDIFIKAFYIYATDVDFDKTCSELHSYMKSHVMDPKTGWVKQNDKWYFYVEGAKQTGWVKDGAKWYFMDESGVMQTGWIKDNGKWYYLDTHMRTGWIKDNNKWYYLNTHMQTGWQFINSKWYYLNNAMVTGWLKVGNIWYYFDANGAMVTGNVKINGKVERFNSKGAWMG